MIHSIDRSGYFGASDTKFIMAANRNTKTWKTWWSTKLGAPAEQISSKFIEAGNKYEHAILRAIDERIDFDGQIIHERYKLRVNYDGWLDGMIYEIKTHRATKEFDLSNAYWQQCQVEMFVYQEIYEQWFLPPFKDLHLASYPLYEDEYDVSWDDVTVDPNRIAIHPIKYDKGWIKGEYLPRVKELVRALKKGKVPA